MAREYFKPGNMLYPVPAVMVSCGREGEKPNIITVAWAGTICSSPAMLSISVRPERYSYEMIRETGEFVVNLVTKDLVCAADYCGVKSGRDVDKFQEMKLTPSPSKFVRAPGIAESPVNLECRVTEVKKLGSHDMFLAEIVGVSVNEEFLDENSKFHLNSTGLVAYSHGEYFLLGEKLGSFGYSVKKESPKKPGKKAGPGRMVKKASPEKPVKKTSPGKAGKKASPEKSAKKTEPEREGDWKTGKNQRNRNHTGARTSNSRRRSK